MTARTAHDAIRGRFGILDDVDAIRWGIRSRIEGVPCRIKPSRAVGIPTAYGPRHPGTLHCNSLFTAGSHELPALERGDVGGVQVEPLTILPLRLEASVPIAFDTVRIVGADHMHHLESFG